MNFEGSFFRCSDSCSGDYRWYLEARGLQRVGCYECEWCLQIEPSI